MNIGGYLFSFSSDGVKYFKLFVFKDNIMLEKERIDFVMKWLIMKVFLNFIVMYFVEFGRIGYIYGFDLFKIENVIEESDFVVVGYFVEKL